MNRLALVATVLSLQTACKARQETTALMSEPVVTARVNERSDFGGLEQTVVSVPSCKDHQVAAGEATAQVAAPGEFKGATFHYSKEWAERLVAVGYSQEIAAWRARSCDVRQAPPTWRLIHQPMSLREAEVGCALMGMELVSAASLDREFHGLEVQLFPNVQDQLAATDTALTYLEWLLQTAVDMQSPADGFWLKPSKKHIDSGRVPPIITVAYARAENRLQSLESEYSQAFYLRDESKMQSLSVSIKAAKQSVEAMRRASTVDTHDLTITTVDRFEGGEVLQINSRQFRADASLLTQRELIEQIKKDGVSSGLWPAYPSMKVQGHEYQGLAVCEQRQAPVAAGGTEAAREFAAAASK
jgi:hypothetical protein